MTAEESAVMCRRVGGHVSLAKNDSIAYNKIKDQA